jgi:hypothetical protein
MRGAHLDESRADLEAVADPYRLGAEARESQVLAERARLRRPAELFGPERVVVGAVEVERLVEAAVVLHVRDDVTGEPERADVPALDRPLSDARRDRARTDLHQLRAARVDGDELQRAAGSKRSFTRLRPSGTRVG